MKISFTCSNGDISVAFNQLSRMLDASTFSDSATLWEDLTLELPDIASSDVADCPSEIMDIINEAIDLLAEDFGIDLEIDSVTEN